MCDGRSRRVEKGEGRRGEERGGEGRRGKEREGGRECTHCKGTLSHPCSKGICMHR